MKHIANSKILLRRDILFGVIIPLLVFLDMAKVLIEDGGFTWDASVLHYLHHHTTSQYDNIMAVITYLGDFRLMIPIAFIIALLFAHGQRLREAGFLLLIVWGTAVLNAVLKVLFYGARPELWLSSAPQFDYGFPSGHSMLTIALVLTLIVLLWRTRWRWPSIIAGSLLVLLVGFSRLYLGVHFPSDVLAAWSITIAWVLGLTIYSGQRKFTTFIIRPDVNSTNRNSWTYINGGEG